MNTTRMTAERFAEIQRKRYRYQGTDVSVLLTELIQELEATKGDLDIANMLIVAQRGVIGSSVSFTRDHIGSASQPPYGPGDERRQAEAVEVPTDGHIVLNKNRTSEQHEALKFWDEKARKLADDKCALVNDNSGRLVSLVTRMAEIHASTIRKP